MSELNFHRKDFVRKRYESQVKVNLCREKFRDLERQRKMDLEKASRIWKKLGKRFRWWGSLP